MVDEVPERGHSHASSSHEVSLEPTFKRREDLCKHSVYTHFPKDRNCEICQRTKITRAPCRRRNGGAVPRAENFGDLITADHKVLSENCESRNNHRYAVVMQDLATQWIQSHPCKTKTSQETQRSLQKFLEPWNHCTSTPHRSETNGIAERAVRRVKEGISAVLLPSGLNESWWSDTLECYTYLRNVTDLLSDGKTPYERRFWQPFKGPIIPYGSLVEYHPITAKDQSRIHQFGKKVLPGLFLGYALYAGRIWKDDASEIYSKRLGDISQRKRRIYFPIAHGRIKPLGGDQDLETSTLRYGRVQFKEKVILTFLENQKGLFHHLTTRFRMPVKQLMISGPCQVTSYTATSRWTQSRTLLAERSIIPYSTATHWCLQNYTYEFGCQARETHRLLLEHRWVKRFVWFLDKFHSVYSIRWKSSWRIYVVLERLTRKRLTSRPDHLWPELWIKMGRNAQLKEKHKWSREELHLDNARKLRGIYFIDPEDKEYKETIKNARKKLETLVAPVMPCKIMKK